MATGYNGGTYLNDWNPLWACMNENGFAQSIRTDYLTPFTQNKFPESTQSIPNYELILDGSVSRGQYPFKYAPGVSYKTYVRSSIPQTLYFTDKYYTNTHYCNTSNFGFTTLYSPFFTRGTFQPYISPTVPQAMLTNGNITQTKFPIYRKKFKIPLASSVFGCLIDQNSYCLLPLQAINDCLL